MKHMSKTKKIILSIVALVTLLAGVGCAYAVSAVKKANQTVDEIYESVDREKPVDNNDKPVNFEATEPFSILLLGVDTGGLGREDQGRSDTMMVVTINPEQKKSTIISLDRDIYTQIVGHGTYDKLNHAYAFGGVGMAMDSVEALLDIPINHYLTINLQGFADLVDAVGGITVDNQYHFELDGVELYPGKQDLDGTQALSYARFRKYNASTGMGDPEGDIGRQRRQREVIEAIVKKILSFNSISRYEDILAAVQKNTKTDLVWNDMLNIVQGYTGAANNIEPLQLEGEGVMMDAIYYQKLYPDKLLTIQNQLKNQLDLPEATELNRSHYADNQFYGEGTTEESSATEEERQAALENTDTEDSDTDWQDDDDVNSNNSWSDEGNQGDGGQTTPSSTTPPSTTPSSSTPPETTPSETTPSSSTPESETPPESSTTPETPVEETPSSSEPTAENP
ncbi:LCP family glycopolymer transferase [Enterococcus timonensis]|uniref:LCP family glycopolymer transferase n=1 Tax=Enterococcus timonensis TaxID=1852364 RepID=UPI0008DB1342|nr:LCP family protein [Enterococcus timonensis]